MTVEQLIEELEKYPADMPVRVSNKDGCRGGEYWEIEEVKKNHLKNQDTSGDPAEWWNDLTGLTKEEKEDCQLNKNDPHFKYKGELVLLS